MKATGLIGLLLLFVFACSEDEGTDVKVDRKQIDKLYSLATEEVTIGGITLRLYVYLQRDFMPSLPPSGSPLASVNWLVDIDSTDIPDHILLSQQYVIYGDTLWVADYADQQRESPPYVIDKVSLDGPRWGPGVEVTVVVRVVDTTNGREYYLIRENQLIVGTA